MHGHCRIWDMLLRVFKLSILRCEILRKPEKSHPESSQHVSMCLLHLVHRPLVSVSILFWTSSDRTRAFARMNLCVIGRKPLPASQWGIHRHRCYKPICYTPSLMISPECWHRLDRITSRQEMRPAPNDQSVCAV